MRIKEYLQESAKLIIAFKDAPAWVKETLKSEQASFGTIDVVTGANVTLPGQVVDHNVKKAYFFTGGKVISQGAANYDTLLNTKKNSFEKALYDGGSILLWDEQDPGKVNMILVTDTHPKKATLYAHPNQMPKNIEKDIELTREEKIVLLITKMYISSYRDDEFKRYKVKDNLETIRASLKGKKLLTAANALSLEGKNVVQKITDGKGTEPALSKLK